MRTDHNENPFNDLLLSPNGKPEFVTGDVMMFAPKYNVKRADADEFQREAKRFREFHGLSEEHTPIHLIDNSRHRYLRAEQVLEHIEVRLNKIDVYELPPQVYNFFGHGFKFGLSSFGFRSPNHPYATDRDRTHFNMLMEYMAHHCGVMMLLYACSTGDDPDDDPDTAPGSGDDSFADWCRDELCALRAWFCRVMAHTTAGHTTVNPMVKFFDGTGGPGPGVGAPMVFDPGSVEFRKWNKMLKGEIASNEMRFRFPFMMWDAIKADVQSRIV